MATDPTPHDAEPVTGASAGPSRRRVIQGAGIAAGALALGGETGSVFAADNRSAGYQGDISDLRHVVILMQENRSFDHYFGALPGIRGFDDRQALTFQDGTSVFQQRDAGGTIVRPRVDDGPWGNDHDAWGDVEHRNWNLWVQHNGASCMNYHSAAYMGFYHSVASQYTLCEQNFCAEFGPTDPNRKYLWSGTSNGETGNTDESNYSRPWTTVAEQLQDAGIDWRLFSDNSGDGRQGYVSSWIGDYGDNELKYFQAFDPEGLSPDDPRLQPGTGLIWRGNCTYYAGTSAPDNDSDQNLDVVLKDFHDACQPGAEFPLPAVSWIVAPYGWTEHPSSDTLHGERYTARVLEILQSNQEIWDHTLFILNFDENDGKFDHVLPPWPEKGTQGEYDGDYPLGFGPRVPMVLVSPWTRGGHRATEVFDQTSTIKFLDTWAASLGKPFTCPNITAWRRSITGDLTSAIDFAHPRPGAATFPDPAAEQPVSISAGHMKPRPLSFQPHATLTEHRHTGKVKATMTLHGGHHGKAVGFQVFPDDVKEFSSTPFTVTTAKSRSYTWDTSETDGKYAFSIYCNDGFVRSFAGQVVPEGQRDVGLPRVEADLVAGKDGGEGRVRLRLHNDGTVPMRFTLTPHDFRGEKKVIHLGGRKSTVVSWPTKNGYYDVVLTADTGNGWRQRYAGRVATVSKEQA
jgi:phospholipase C